MALKYLVTADAKTDLGSASSLIPNTLASSTLTISSGAITPTRASHIVAAESGTSDDLATITTTNFKTGDTIKIVADSGDTITVKASGGNITTEDGADITLDAATKFCWLHVTASGVTASLGGGVSRAGPAVFDVMDPVYGAKFDGSTNDTSAINAAIAAAIAYAKPAVVLMPAGKTVISSPLNINATATAGAQVTLKGAGSGATVISLASSYNATHAISFGTSSTYTRQTFGGLRGFSVIGDSSSNCCTTAGIIIYNAYKAVFDDIVVENVILDGYRSQGHADHPSGDPANQFNTHTGIRARNCGGYGMYFLGEKAGRFDDLSADGCTLGGIFWDAQAQTGGATETTENVIGKCVAANCSGPGYSFSGISKFVVGELLGYINSGPCVRFRTRRSGSSYGSTYSSFNSIVSRNCAGAIDTVIGDATTVLNGSSIGSIVAVGAYPSDTTTAIVMAGWTNINIGSVTAELCPSTVIRIKDQTGSTYSSGITIGAAQLTNNGSSGASDNDGISIEGSSSDIRIGQCTLDNDYTTSAGNGYEVRVGVNCTKIAFDQAYLAPAGSGRAYSVGNYAHVNFSGVTFIDGEGTEIVNTGLHAVTAISGLNGYTRTFWDNKSRPRKHVVYNDGSRFGMAPVFWNGSTQIASPSNTSLNTLVTQTIPGESLGNNGYIEVETMWLLSGSSATARIRYGGTEFATYALTGNFRGLLRIYNRNSTSSQVSQNGGASGGFGSGGGIFTGSINTSNNQDLTILVEKTVGGDTLTLEYWNVETFYRNT